MKINLLNHVIDVEQSDPGLWSERSYGRALLIEGKILINKVATPSVYKHTLIHELIHMIYDINGVDHPDERDIDMLAIGIVDLIANNDNLVDLVMHDEIDPVDQEVTTPPPIPPSWVPITTIPSLLEEWVLFRNPEWITDDNPKGVMIGKRNNCTLPLHMRPEYTFQDKAPLYPPKEWKHI